MTVEPLTDCEAKSTPVLSHRAGQDPSGTLWYDPAGSEIRCEIRLTAEVDGGYSAYAPELPGVASEGDSAEAALKNIAEALRGALRTYRHEERSIPWLKKAEPVRHGESCFRIIVHV